jgi:hypothetical protein
VKLGTKRNERFLQGRRRTPVIRVRADHRRAELGDARSSVKQLLFHAWSVFGQLSLPAKRCETHSFWQVLSH